MDMMWYRRRGLMVTPHIERATGAVASFNSAYNKIPVKSLICNIDPIQEGSGDPSPENVRPISGRTGLTVFHSRDDTSNPSTIPVNWETEAGTVYGGYVDVVSGKLVVDRAIVDLGTLNWTRINTQAGHWRFYCAYNIMKQASTLLSSQYMQITPSQQYAGGQGVATQQGGTYGTNTLIMVLDERYEDETTFKTAMNGVQLVYELTAPTEIQLSGQEVKTLIDNSIWCDSGNVTVDYWKWGR